MPTYEYVCKKCGHQLEAVQSFSDAALTICPECSGPLRKQFGSVGVVFKGSGFYRTDSREENRSKKAEAKSDGANKDGAKKDGANKDGAKKDGAKKDGAAPPSKKDSPKPDGKSGGKNKPVEKSNKKR